MNLWPNFTGLLEIRPQTTQPWKAAQAALLFSLLLQEMGGKNKTMTYSVLQCLQHYTEFLSTNETNLTAL